MTLEREEEERPTKKHRGTHIDELLLEQALFPDDRKYVPVPFEEIVNWQLHPTRPVAPIAHRRK